MFKWLLEAIEFHLLYLMINQYLYRQMFSDTTTVTIGESSGSLASFGLAGDYNKFLSKILNI